MLLRSMLWIPRLRRVIASLRDPVVYGTFLLRNKHPVLRTVWILLRFACRMCAASLHARHDFVSRALTDVIPCFFEACYGFLAFGE